MIYCIFGGMITYIRRYWLRRSDMTSFEMKLRKRKEKKKSN
jgi:hypothetical protein